jgi:gag-polyprotein putative aspartyl protease
MIRLTELPKQPRCARSQNSSIIGILSGLISGRWLVVITLILMCSACQDQSNNSSGGSAANQSTDGVSGQNAGKNAPATGTNSTAKLKVVPATQPSMPIAADPRSKPSQTPVKPAIPEIQFTSSPAYQQALDRAESAESISASAQSPEDWQLVINQWKESIALMKQVSPKDPNRKLALQQLTRMEAGLTQSKQKLDRLTTSKPDLTIATGPVSEPRRGIYRAAIKYYSGGIPVVDVVFNGGQRFEMMVDTGASGTMITHAMAQQLRVKTVGSVQATTPSGNTQFEVGYIDSMVVGGGALRAFPVAIGPVALLGHDFFGDCNISIKRDQNIVEFSQCKS